MKYGKKKETTGIQTGKKETELSPHAYIFVYEENFKACVKASVSFIKISGYRVNIQKSTLFPLISNKQMVTENLKIIAFTIAPPE